MNVAQEKLLKSWRHALGAEIRKHKDEIDQYDSFVDRDMIGILEEERPRIERIDKHLGNVSAAVRDELSKFVRGEDLVEAEAGFLSEAVHLLNAAVSFFNDSIVLVDAEESFERLADGVRNMRRAWDKIAVAVNLPDASYGRKKQRDIEEVERRSREEPEDMEMRILGAMEANSSRAGWPKCTFKKNMSDPTKRRYRAFTLWPESRGGTKSGNKFVTPWFKTKAEALVWADTKHAFHGGHKIFIEEGSAIRASR
jgi:hypothetical protein